jgi:hypothetical protein
MIEELLRAILLAACIILPAWAFVKSEDGEEM